MCFGIHVSSFRSNVLHLDGPKITTDVCTKFGAYQPNYTASNSKRLIFIFTTTRTSGLSFRRRFFPQKMPKVTFCSPYQSSQRMTYAVVLTCTATSATRTAQTSFIDIASSFDGSDKENFQWVPRAAAYICLLSARWRPASQTVQILHHLSNVSAAVFEATLHVLRNRRHMTTTCDFVPRPISLAALFEACNVFRGSRIRILQGAWLYLV